MARRRLSVFLLSMLATLGSSCQVLRKPIELVDPLHVPSQRIYPIHAEDERASITVEADPSFANAVVPQELFAAQGGDSAAPIERLKETVELALANSKRFVVAEQGGEYTLRIGVAEMQQDGALLFSSSHPLGRARLCAQLVRSVDGSNVGPAIECAGEAVNSSDANYENYLGLRSAFSQGYSVGLVNATQKAIYRLVHDIQDKATKSVFVQREK